jgi:hypothetical protein
MLISDTPDARASSTCVHPRMARAARIWAGEIMSATYRRAAAAASMATFLD